MNILCIMTTYYAIRSLNNSNMFSRRLEKQIMTISNPHIQNVPTANIHMTTDNIEEELQKFFSNPFVMSSFLNL